MEDIICGHLFRGRGYKVIIDDRYELSSQYNTRTLTEVYKDSILYDVEKISHVGYRLLKRAEWYYSDDIITLAMEDSKLSKSHSIGIKKYLEETYKKRFGMDIKVGFDYTESDKEMLRRANEQKIKRNWSEKARRMLRLKRKHLHRTKSRRRHLPPEGRNIPRMIRMYSMAETAKGNW